MTIETIKISTGSGLQTTIAIPVYSAEDSYQHLEEQEKEYLSIDEWA